MTAQDRESETSRLRSAAVMQGGECAAPKRSNIFFTAPWTAPTENAKARREPASPGSRRLPRHANQQVREAGGFRDMRTGKSGKNGNPDFSGCESRKIWILPQPSTSAK